MSIRKLKRRAMARMGSTVRMWLTFQEPMAEYLRGLTQIELDALVNSALKHAMRRGV